MKKAEADKLGDDLSKYMIDRIRKDGALDMALYVISGANTRVIRGFDANSSQQKDLIAELARYLAKKHKAESVVLSCESFTAQSDRASPEDMKELEEYRQKHGTLEGHPLTVEAVFLSIEIPNNTVVRCYPFTRDDNDEVEKVLDPIDFGEGTSMDGKLCNIMKPEKRIPVPDEMLAEMEKATVEIIPTKNLGLYFHEGYSPSVH